MKLDVYSNNRLAGTLEQVDLTRFVFTYAPNVGNECLVSLLMPVRTESWVHRFLHPTFQVSLPEGALRQFLTRKFAKQFAHFGDTELLGVIGSHLVGRLKIVTHGHTPDVAAPQEDLRELLKESPQEIIDHYLELHGQYSGVSGGFTKFLARTESQEKSDGSKSPTKDVPGSTLTFDNWILKSNDPEHPELVQNEYFGMLLARRMGLEVPDFQISDDAQRLAVRRFDITDDGTHLGFEDMCALMGLNAEDKFSGSVERVLKTINTFCSPTAAAQARAQFYAQYVACMAIRNGDAHLKNFGLVYTGPTDARMCPVYDMVTMSAYAPTAQSGDALDEPAMTLDGVRRWLTEKSQSYLAARCLVPKAQQADVSRRLVQAMGDTAKDIFALATEGREAFRPMGKRLLELWSHGIALHDQGLSTRLREMADAIDTEDTPYVKRSRQTA